MTALSAAMPTWQPEPAVADDDTREWWDATRDERLCVQVCSACGHAQLYPRSICRACGGARPALRAVTGRGTVYSFTVVHRAAQPGMGTPYVIALVRLAEGPVLLTRIVECRADDVRCDMEVEVGWVDVPDGRRLPVFGPRGEH